jgi:hypothetical protein
VGVVGSIVGAAFVWTSVSNRVLSGRLDDAFITSKGIVGVVGIVHSGAGDGSWADYRLTLIDAATGRRQARRVLGSGPPKCAELRPGRLWCRDEDGLVLLDVATLEVKSDWAALQRSMPMLTVGLKDVSMRTVDSRLLVVADDGRGWLLQDDPPTATASDAAQQARAVPLPNLGERQGSVVSGGVTLGFIASEGVRKVVVPAPVPGLTPAADAGLPRETFLEPSFLPVHGLDGTVAGLEGQGGALVLHRDTLARVKAHELLTRVDLEGRVLWMHDFGAGEVQFAVAQGALVVVVGNFPDGLAVGLDGATGAELWRTSF